MDWKLLTFGELSTDQLYDIIYLREKIFVVEQACAYQEADGYDRTAYHLMGVQDGKLMGYARLFPPNIEYYGDVMPEDAIIGRVISHPDARGTGIGHDIMKNAIAGLQRVCGKMPHVTISAQARLVPFYNQHGFVSTSDVYLEDGQPHIRMRRVAA